MSDCIMSTGFLILALYLLPCLALGQKYSPPSSLLVIPMVWCLSVLEFLQDPYLETLYPQTFVLFCFFTPKLFLPYPQSSFLMSLIGCVVNSVKSCTLSGQLSSAGIFYFRPVGFCVFFYNKVIFSGIILPRFL